MSETVVAEEIGSIPEEFYDKPSLCFRPHLKEFFSDEQNSGQTKACCSVAELHEHVFGVATALPMDPKLVWAKINNRNWIAQNDQGHYYVSPR